MGKVEQAITIPMKDLIVVKEFNFRKELDVDPKKLEKLSDTDKLANPNVAGWTIDGLVEDIKRNGQLQPVLVRPPKDGKYALIGGFRRVEALRKLNAETVKVVIFDGTDYEARRVNLAENIIRKSLTAYEVASAIFALHKEEEKGAAALARDLGLSTGHVSNYIRFFENLHPRILKAWEKGLGIITTTELKTWASLEKDEQLERYAKLVEGVDEDGDEEGDDGKTDGKGKSKTKKDKKGRPGMATLELALKSVAASKEGSQSVRDGMKMALEFALGKRKSLGDIFDPSKLKAEIEKAKQAETEAKKREKLLAKKAEIEKELAAN